MTTSVDHAAASFWPPRQAGQVTETVRIGTLPRAAAAAILLLLWLLASVTLLLAALAVGLGFLIGPPLARQGADLASSLADEASALQQYGDTARGRRIQDHLLAAARHVAGMLGDDEVRAGA